MTRAFLAFLLFWAVAVLGAAQPVPIGIGNNNPGNISPAHLRNWRGGIGYDLWGYAKFRSKKDGLLAIRRNLNCYWRLHGICTIRGIVNRWTSLRISYEDRRDYETKLSNATNHAPWDRLDMTSPQILRALAHGIVREENGVDPYAPNLYDSVFRN